MHLAGHDDAAADGGAGLDGDAVSRRAELGPVFAECGEVRVVVDQCGHAEELLQVLSDAESRPTGHARGLIDGASADVDGAGQSDADGMESLVAGELAQYGRDGVQGGGGAFCEVDVEAAHVLQLTTDSVSADARVSAAEVDREDDTRLWRDAQHPGCFVLVNNESSTDPKNSVFVKISFAKD